MPFFFFFQSVSQHFFFLSIFWFFFWIVQKALKCFWFTVLRGSRVLHSNMLLTGEECLWEPAPLSVTIWFADDKYTRFPPPPPKDLGNRLDVNSTLVIPNTLIFIIMSNSLRITVSSSVFKDWTYSTCGFTPLGCFPWRYNVFILFSSLDTSYSFFKSQLKTCFLCEVFPG